MSRTIRYDEITLHNEASEEEFEKFMKEELIPFFSQMYKGPKRGLYANLKSQTLLKNIEGNRKWLWETAWDGDARGSFFEDASVSGTMEKTEAMLKRLEFFGQRATEDVFTEVDFIEIGTNT